MPYKNIVDGFWLRQEELIKPNSQKKLRESRVLCAGIGANGSIFCEIIVRMGITDLIIADPDIVELSNLNRQNFVYKDVGSKKVYALANRLRAINPTIRIQTINTGINNENCDSLVRQCDIVMDACDDYPTKVLLSRIANRLSKPLVHHSGGAYRGAVTVFHNNYNYEEFFELPTIGIDDSYLKNVNFENHKKKVLNSFGANLFSLKKNEEISISKKLIWPTMAGACDIAATIAAIQTVLLIIEDINHIIFAPFVFRFDVLDLNFEILNYSIQANRIYKKG